MEKKSHLIIIISVVTGILLAALVGILVFFNLPAQRIRRMLKTANKYITEENYDEAILTLQKMLEIDPKNEDLYFLLADTYEKNGEIDKELEFIQEVVGMMPENEILSENFTGWWDIDGNRYYFDENGELLKNQWIDDTYYVGGDGAMLKDRWIDDTYYVDDDGIMLINTYTPDGYYVGEDGRRVESSDNLSTIETPAEEPPVSSLGQILYNSPRVADEINSGQMTMSYNGRAVQIISSRNNIIHDRGTYYEIPDAVLEGAVPNIYESEYEDLASGPIYVRKSATVDFYESGGYVIKTAEQIYQMYGSLCMGESHTCLRTIGCATEVDADGYITKLSVHPFE